MKGQTWPENEPLRLEGKAKLRDCHLSALPLKVKGQEARCEQHRPLQHAPPSALLFSSPALKPEKSSALGGYMVSHPKTQLRCDPVSPAMCLSASPKPSSLSVGADGTRLIKLASAVSVLTSAAVTRGS